MRVALLLAACHVAAASLPQPLQDAAVAKAQRLASERAHEWGAAPTVATVYGTLSGVTMQGGAVNAYLGVPFAQQPIGDLRWRNPVAPAPWGHLNATWYGPACMQDDSTWGILAGYSEACLNLNVYAPAAPAGAGALPVMVFLHGGSWMYGSNSFPLYDAAPLVARERAAIVVTVNYRLSVFGFLAGDVLKAEDPDGSVGNYGLVDQRAALRFVQATIAAFGGDPARVMLFGESAGAGSTSAHLASPRSWGLFSRALTQSTLGPNWAAQPYDIAATRFQQIADALGCAGSGGAPFNASAALACMRAAPAAAVLNADSGAVTHGLAKWAPVIDGVELNCSIAEAFAAGAVAPGVPIAGGFNANEGTLFIGYPANMSVAEYLPALEGWLGPQLGPRVAAAYPPASYRSPWWALAAVMGDSTMVCPAQAAARGLAGRGAAPPPLFVYYYTHTLAFVAAGDATNASKPLGCFHGSELFLVFDALPPLLYGPGESALAALVGRYWTRFAASGDPNGAGDPTWPAFTPASPAIAMLDTAAAAGGVNVTVLTGGVAPALCKEWAAMPIPNCIEWGGGCE